MRILIDAMGGDNAPREIVRGGVDAAREFQVDVALVGRAEAIRACLQEYGAVGEPRVTVVDAPDVITMEDDPSSAVRRKKDSSMARGPAASQRGGGGRLHIRREHRGAAERGHPDGAPDPRDPPGLLWPGAAQRGPGSSADRLRRQRGVHQRVPAPVCLHGQFLRRKIMGCHRPRIGLLNIGAEETKGTQLQKQTYELLSQAGPGKGG